MHAQGSVADWMRLHAQREQSVNVGHCCCLSSKKDLIIRKFINFLSLRSIFFLKKNCIFSNVFSQCPKLVSWPGKLNIQIPLPRQ